jgi:hypothetical protein
MVYIIPNKKVFQFNGEIMKKIIIILSLLSVFPLWATISYALGVGMYIPLGIGKSEHTIDLDDGPDLKFDYDASYHGLGFVLDSNVAGKSTFNYRLNVGIERGEYTPDKNYGGLADSFDHERITVDSTFGFAVLQTETVRLSVGPQVRVAYLNSDEYGQNKEIKALGFGLGPVLGVNFNIGPTATLCVDSGYRFTRYYGNNNDNDKYDYHNTNYDSDDDELFMNFSVIFRINDVYK